MAYDEDIAERVRDLLGAEPALTEKKMFGGLAFLMGGHMAVIVSGRGGLMVRGDPDDSDRLLQSKGVETVQMRGRPMRGWVRVDTEYLRTKRQLTRWVKVGVAYASSLPPKG